MSLLTAVEDIVGICSSSYNSSSAAYLITHYGQARLTAPRFLPFHKLIYHTAYYYDGMLNVK